MKNPLLRLAVSVLILTLSPALSARESVDFVNPFIGTTNFGACNPGAVTPAGMMSVVPFNVMGSPMNAFDKDARWWSTPYEQTNSFLTGFAHGTLSGVGCPEMGSLLTMPTTGTLETDYHLYGTPYSDQEATPGYYAVTLTEYGIRAEATATTRTSVERYTFPGGSANILLNLGEGLTNESGAMVRRVSPTEIEGTKLLGTFCYCSDAVFPVYFVMRVSRVPSSQGCWKKQRQMTAEAAWEEYSGKNKLYPEFLSPMAGDDIGYWYHWNDLPQGEQIEVRMGISYVSVENARENLDAETAPFEEVRASARSRWASDLDRIKVTGGTDDQKTVFYTALYHALIHPNILNDVNGEYPLMNGQGIGHTDSERYTVFSLWDTYRNVHQLLTLVYPEKQIKMVRTMLDICSEWGWLPKWELYGRETWTMEGDPAIPVIVDTWMKGLRDFDIAGAYQAMKKGAVTPGRQNRMRPDIDEYMEKGYVPLRGNDNSVSHALEYYVADNALSRMASALGFGEDAELFRTRSLGYRNYWSEEYGCLRPRLDDGTFLTPFDPRQGENFENAPGFHEGSAWNYTFYVPHDVDGLAKLMGGPQEFVRRLQKVFDDGLYDPANEPDIAYPYLFSRFRGEQWRTQKLVSELLKKHFTTAPDGIPGNDDTGTMSAWAVFSMMGFYPDCPGEPYYTLTAPVFDRVEINIAEGGKLIIEAPHRSEKDIYVRSVSLGGKSAGGYRISHQELLDGGTLTFWLSDSRPR